MGETDNDYPATEQAAAHPGSSPRTLERYRVRDGCPLCVSCCSRVHDLRSGLGSVLGRTGAPSPSNRRTNAAATGTEWTSEKINFAVANLRNERT